MLNILILMQFHVHLGSCNVELCNSERNQTHVLFFQEVWQLQQQSLLTGYFQHAYWPLDRKLTCITSMLSDTLGQSFYLYAFVMRLSV